MHKTVVFSGITRSDTEKIKKCFSFEETYYMQGEKIYTYNSDKLCKIGAVTEGEAIIVYRDKKKTYKTELLKKGEPFGELFSLPSPCHTIEVSAKSDCGIIMCDYQRLLKPCESSCYCHAVLLSNLFKISAERARSENLRLSVLKEKNAREKLLAYFAAEAEKKGPKFEIALSQAELADYLCLDRSSMARSISLLRSEGTIKSKGRHFEITSFEK